MSAIEIRPFETRDREAVVELWRACQLVHPTNDPNKDIVRKTDDSPSLFFVAVQDGALAGSVMAGYEGHRGWLNYLAVAPDKQRSGIGRQLVEHCERILEARGCPKINLQIRATNADVVQFYESLGYQEDPVISLGKRLIIDDQQ